MDNNDSNMKSQQTGGLKLMTVFIAVLALHVVVIGGFTVYHLLSGGSADTDLTSTDKNHKALKNTDSSSMAETGLPDASTGDKTASTSTPPTEVANIPANPPATTPEPTTAPAPAPEPSLQAPTATPAPTLAPAPALTQIAPKLTPMPGPQISTPEVAAPKLQATLTPEPAPTLIPTSPAPTAPTLSGPVHMPPAIAPAPTPVAHKTYVVKITDSYKKIAAAHHITVAQLKEANHIKGDVLHTGQKLIIPSAKSSETESVASTSLETAPSVAALSEAAPATTAMLTSSASSTITSLSHSHVYTVMKGDTLTKIAHKFKTTTTALISENNITDPTKLSIGKKLKIPSRESRSAKNGEPATTQPAQVQAKENSPSPQLANFVH